MILLDNSQIILANIFHSMKDNPTINDDFIRHMVLNSYRLIRKKFSLEYGQLIICNDSPNCWRKEVFPLYKQNRKIKQKTGNIDWTQIYSSMSKIVTEVANVFPYKNIKIEGAEADDIIAILARNFHNDEKIVIVSNDKDFQQLQVYENIKQYSTFQKDFIVCANPRLFLCEHIIRGDASDGVPNILSDDDTIINVDKRQGKITKKVMQDALSSLDTIETSKYSRNWNRNKTLIDFSHIPQSLEDKIMEAYKIDIKHSHTILDDMIEHKLNNLIGSISEF